YEGTQMFIVCSGRSSYQDRPADHPLVSKNDRSRVLLRRKSEMHHVAVGDFVLLAFQPQLADVARAGLAAALDVILVRDGLGADEVALEVPLGPADAGGFVTIQARV